MGRFKEVAKDYCISHQIQIRCMILIPDVYYDENLASAMGRDVKEKEENLEEFSEEILGPQYLSMVKESIRSYESSNLPMKFIKGQKIRIEVLPYGVNGVYDKLTDTVIEDSDTTISNRNEFTFGRCMGNKILSMRKDANNILNQISNIVGISDIYIAEKLFCEEVGNIVAKTDFPTQVLTEELPKEKVLGIRKELLKYAWSI